ncbi:PKD domain-containing protein [Methanosarcina hadiensis]|uniref:right-handed parallel beta-helix repeat-containing protein n=1 Tax=Methanosarcina hadiensis TaxID=3078083 RepID=UPI003977C40B
MEIKNIFTILLGIFLVLVLISGAGSAAEIVIQPGSSIQTAVNNANSGDTIILKPGTYSENLNITKGNITIRSQSENPDDTIIKSKNSRDAILLQAPNITISGIKVTGSGSSYAGINLYKCSKCVIEKSKVTNNGYGIRLTSSSRCTISKNTVTDNVAYGIYLGSSSLNTISGNTANNDNRGIHVGSSDDNKLSGNTVTSNSASGMYVCGLSDRNLIYDNYFNNTNMTIKSGIGNSYNTTKTAGKNVVGGTYIGGNFWGKPDGSGFSNKATDKDGDGISDSPYTNITSSIYSDYLPLVTSSSPSALEADFSSNVTSGTAPLNVQFNDASTGSPTAWNWSFGDGTYSAVQNPAHIYSSAGNYTVALTVSNAAGSNTATKLNYIKVTGTAVAKPVLNYWGSPRNGTAPHTVYFKDNSSNSPTAWNWTFGDGTYSTERNPVHTYTKPGTYTIYITVSNAAGSTSGGKGNYITVTGNSSTMPVAAFSASPTSGNAPLNVTFTDSSTGSPTAWNWSFGDGTYSTEKNPVHTYTAAGNYTVALTVSNTAGSNTATKSNYIVVTGTAVQKPVASFSSNVTSGKVPLNVQFNDTSTGSPATWNWNFGDGNSSTEKNPKHIYSTAGNYTVALTVSNAAGSNTATKSNYITVAGTALAKPVLNYWGSPRNGTVPHTVSFKDNSSNSPTAWNWTFGDGTYSTERNPVHTYTKPGTYTIYITVTNAAGSTSGGKGNYITVTGNSSTMPVAAFSASPASGSAPLNVTFTDISTGSPTAWNWSFGDGTYSTSKSPVHKYSSAGNYTVALTATNAAGSNTVTKSNYIKVTGTVVAKPVLNYWGSPRNGTAPHTVSFKDNSSNSPTAWKWNFGDGTYSTERNPVHTYTKPGTYTIYITVTNEAGSTSGGKGNYITVKSA